MTGARPCGTFVQIQMNYVDWKHAGGRNVNADYLYGELEKRGIPAVIMEPLLGGRLSRLNDHLSERLKERRPTQSTASWAFRFAVPTRVLTVLSGMTYMEHLQDNIRTYSPLEPCTDDELALLEDTAQVMLKYPHPCPAPSVNVLHALPLRTGHSGDFSPTTTAV